MAEWIKWTKGLAKRREVAVLASILGKDCHEIAGRLMVLWEWCDENFADADIDPVSLNVSLLLGDNAFEFVDELCGLPGMAEALTSPGVRWLEARSGGRLVFPALARHNGTSAKTRAYEARKKQKQRTDASSCPPLCPESTGTFLGTKPGPDKKREEKIENKDTFLSEGCSEASKPPSEPPILTFQCVKGLDWFLVQSQVDAWTEAYPAVEILAECRKAKVWVDANPAKRKTRNGMAAFLNRWLSNAQNRGGGVGKIFPTQTPSGQPSERQSELERRTAALHAQFGGGSGD